MSTCAYRMMGRQSSLRPSRAALVVRSAATDFFDEISDMTFIGHVLRQKLVLSEDREDNDALLLPVQVASDPVRHLDLGDFHFVASFHWTLHFPIV